MNRLDTKERARILGCLVEGNSMVDAKEEVSA
jgi:hypothetical protein